MAYKIKLTDRQKRTCQEYNIHPKSKADAYRKVYKCSKATAATEGPRTLRIPHVKAYLKTLQDKKEERAKKSAADVVAELEKIGFSNIKTMYKKGFEVTDIVDLPDEVTAAIESVQVDIRHDSGDGDGYVEKVKIKNHSKLGALRELGRHHNIFEKDNDRLTVVIKENLTEEELKAKLKAIQEAGTGLDTQSIGGT